MIPRSPPRPLAANHPWQPGSRRLILGLALGIALPFASSRADLPAEAVRKIAQANQDSVLFLSGTVKYLCGRCPDSHDFRVLSTAVVVDAKGLFLAARLGPLLEPKAEIRESHLHVVAADGAEVAVRVSVTDSELGVLVLALENPGDAAAHPFKPVPLENAAPAKLLDELVVLRRFDQRLGYALQTFVVRIGAIDKRPRTHYLSAGFPDQELPLAPCFDGNGGLVGFYTGAEAAVAVEEFTDLVAQARRRLAR